MEDLPDDIERIAARLNALEQRIYALEHPAGTMSADSLPTPSVQAATDDGNLLTMTSGAVSFSIVGRAALGIAGAYLLRALAEWSVLPNTVVAAVAIAYALTWLVAASRAKSGGWFSGVVYAATSGLILAPMLWELTLRFNVLSPQAAAVVLAGFAVVASLLARQREQAAILWVVSLMAVGIALTLSVTSYRFLPFIYVLLLMALISEYGASRGRVSGVRVVVSLAADVAIWALIFIYSSQESTRPNYPALTAGMLIPPGLALFATAGGSVLYSAFIAKKQIAVFGLVQTATAFGLAVWAILSFAQHGAVIGFGALCIATAAAGYAATLMCFKTEEERRNLLVIGSWSCALLIAGSLMCLPAHVQPIWLGSWAVATSWTGARTARMQLELHGLILLMVAAAETGFVSWMTGVFAGAMPEGVSPAAYLIAICAMANSTCVFRDREEGWKYQTLATATAVLAACSVTAILVRGLTGLVAMNETPGAHHIAFVRTLAICIVAIVLTFGGAFWGRVALTKIGYGSLVLLVPKIALEDLRHGKLAYISGSIFLFATSMILVPRLVNLGQKLHRLQPEHNEGMTSLRH